MVYRDTKIRQQKKTKWVGGHININIVIVDGVELKNVKDQIIDLFILILILLLNLE